MADGSIKIGLDLNSEPAMKDLELFSKHTQTLGNAVLKTMNTLGKGTKTALSSVVSEGLKYENTMQAMADSSGSASSALGALTKSAQGMGSDLASSADLAQTAFAEMGGTLSGTFPTQLAAAETSLSTLKLSIFQGIETPLNNALATASYTMDGLASCFATPAMQSALASIGQGIGLIIETVSSLASTFLPPLVEILGFFGEHMNILLPLIGGITLGIQAYNAVLPLITAAQWLLNAAMAANPAALIALAIGGLVAIGSTLLLSWGSQTEKADELTESLKRQEEAYARIKEKQDEQILSITNESGYMLRLTEELDGLVDSTGRIIGSKERVKEIVDQLNEKYPGYIQMLNDENVEYQKSPELLEKVIKAKEANAILEAKLPAYKEALKNATSLANAQTQKEIELEQEKIKLYELQEKQKKAQEAGDIEAAHLRDEIDELLVSIKDKQTAYDEDQKKLENYYKEINDYSTDSKNIQQENYDAVISSANAKAAGLKNAEESTTDELKKQTQIQYDTYMGKLRERAQGNEDISNEMLETLRQNLKYANDEYEKSGGESVEAFKTAANADLPSAMGAMATVMADESNTLKETGKLEGIEIGDNLDAGVAEGITTNSGKIAVAFTNALNDAYVKGKNSMQIESPSKLMRDEVGAMIAKGVAVGIEENAEEATKAFERLMTGLDYQRDLDLISEADYYAQMEHYRDEYLTAGTKEWMDATVKLYKFRKDQADKEAERLKKQYKDGKISAEAYYAALQQIQSDNFEQGTEAWEEYTERMNEIVEDQLAVLDDYKQEVADLWAEMAESAWDNMDEVLAAQDKLASKLKDYGALYDEVTFQGVNFSDEALQNGNLWRGDDGTVHAVRLHDISSDIQALKEYRDALQAIKSRGNIPPALFAALRDMSVEDGTRFAKELARVPDDEFNSYIAQWQSKQDISDDIAGTLYADERTEAQKYIDEAEAVGEDIMAMCEEMGLEIPETFFESGKKSAESFGEAFQEKLGTVLDKAREMVSFAMGSLMPVPVQAAAGSISVGAAGDAAATYTANYNFYASNETTSQQIAAAKAAAELDHTRGIV